MNQQILLFNKQQSNVTNFQLILLAFGTAFFSRIINALGAPSIINFVHFATVPFALCIALATTKAKDKKQISISWMLIYGMMIFLAVMTASAFLNRAGIINIVLDYLLLAEPFMFVLAIVCIPVSIESIQKLRYWLLAFSIINIITFYAQWILLMMGRLYYGQYTPSDALQGVFYLSGAGNYVSVSISICVAFYYFLNAKNVPLWIRGLGIFAACSQLAISDSKQVALAFIIAWALLSLTKTNDIGKLLGYLIGVIVIILALFWAIENVDLEIFKAFKNWTDRAEIYGPNGEATQLKIAALRIIPSYFKSPLNWLFGLGPGHTVGRLGGWTLTENWQILGPLGATIHPASAAVRLAWWDSWVGRETTMFCPLFGWAGIWGDLGFIGLAAYLYLSFIVWRYLCVDDLCKFLLLSIFVFGLIFTQMEEPGYMLAMAFIIALRWQENKIRLWNQR